MGLRLNLRILKSYYIRVVEGKTVQACGGACRSQGKISDPLGLQLHVAVSHLKGC